MNNSSHSTNWKLVWFLFTIIILSAWVSSCGQPGSVTPITEEPPTATPTTVPTDTPETEPTQELERQECDRADGTYTCQGLDGHEITLEGIPDGVTPYLLAVTPAFRDFLLGPEAKKLETTCIFMLAGDLAFYDEKDELVTSFENPVTITYAYLPQDTEAFLNCQKEAETATGVSAEEVQYVPVYYDKDVWQPFKEYEVNTDSGVMTISFTAWGDQPIGGGSQP